MSAAQARPGTLQGRASLPLPPRFPAAGETPAAPLGLLTRQLSTASADSSAFATARSAPLSVGAAAAAATGSAGAPAFTYSAAERLPAMAGEDDQLEFDEDALFTEDHDEVRLCRFIYPCNGVRRVCDALASDMGTAAQSAVRASHSSAFHRSSNDLIQICSCFANWCHALVQAALAESMSSDEEDPVRPAVAAAAEEGGSSSSSDDEIAEEVAQAAEMRRSGSAAALEGGQAQLKCPFPKWTAMPRPLCDWRAAAGKFPPAGPRQDISCRVHINSCLSADLNPVV